MIEDSKDDGIHYNNSMEEKEAEEDIINEKNMNALWTLTKEIEKEKSSAENALTFGKIISVCVCNKI